MITLLTSYCIFYYDTLLIHIILTSYAKVAALNQVVDNARVQREGVTMEKEEDRQRLLAAGHRIDGLMANVVLRYHTRIVRNQYQLVS